MREVPDRGMCRVTVAPLMLLLLFIFVNIASAQIPARVETPYTLMDAQSRPNIEGGVEIPLRGGLLTGYAYLFARGRTSSMRTSTCA